MSKSVEKVRGYNTPVHGNKERGALRLHPYRQSTYEVYTMYTLRPQYSSSYGFERGQETPLTR